MAYSPARLHSAPLMHYLLKYTIILCELTTKFAVGKLVISTAIVDQKARDTQSKNKQRQKYYIKNTVAVMDLQRQTQLEE